MKKNLRSRVYSKILGCKQLHIPLRVWKSHVSDSKLFMYVGAY